MIRSRSRPCGSWCNATRTTRSPVPCLSTARKKCPWGLSTCQLKWTVCFPPSTHSIIDLLFYTDGFTHYSWPLMRIFASSSVSCRMTSRTLGSVPDGGILWKKDSTRHTFAIMQMSRKRYVVLTSLISWHTNTCPRRACALVTMSSTWQIPSFPKGSQQLV
jgi:hypothetical protein